MSRRIQLTIADEIYESLVKEADKHKARVTTYAALIFSDAVLECRKRGRFDDGFD